MATVEIRVDTGNDSYKVELEMPETYEQVWGADKTHLDNLVQRAVEKMKAAYR